MPFGWISTPFPQNLSLGWTVTWNTKSSLSTCTALTGGWWLTCENYPQRKQFLTTPLFLCARRKSDHMGFSAWSRLSHAWLRWSMVLERSASQHSPRFLLPRLPCIFNKERCVIVFTIALLCTFETKQKPAFQFPINSHLFSNKFETHVFSVKE